MTDDLARAPRPLPAPFWGLLTLPFGLTVGFATVAVPFVLGGRGVPMMLIATVSQVAQLPHVIKPLWSPVLDAGPKRKTWYFASIAATAVGLAATALIPPSLDERVGGLPMIWVYTGALFLAQAAVGTSGSAVLGMIAVTVPDARRGAASGWQTAGNLAGTSIGGALIAWMIKHASPGSAVAVLVGLCALSAIPAAFVAETPPPKRSIASLLRDLFREARKMMRSTAGWTGMVVCLTPVGAGALTNLFSALARDYAPNDAAAERLGLGVAGVLAGVVNMAGALLGGVLADRMNRRLAYALCGALSGICAAAMIVAPATPSAFVAGSLAYQLANGLCYAVFYAFILELVSGAGGVTTVTTQLSLYIGASNFAASYVTWLDGWGYDRAKSLGASGRVGMLALDALATLAGLVVLGAMILFVRRRAKKT